MLDQKLDAALRRVSSPLIELRAHLAYGAVHPRVVAEREDRLASIDGLALALRRACQNQGMTYSDCLDRVSLAWGPGGPRHDPPDSGDT